MSELFYQYGGANMLKIAICDDDEISLSMIKHILTTYSRKTKTRMLIHTFLHGEDLLAAEKQKHYNIHILDIMMPNMDGIELAKALRRNGDENFLIFLTSSDEYTKDAYLVDAIQYLMKPVNPEKLIRIIERIHGYIQPSQTDSILVQTKQGILKLNTDEIVFIEHINHVIYFHKFDGTVVTSLTSTLTLGEVFDVLKENPHFFKPHRAYIVNMNYIQSLTRTDLILKNNQSIPIPCRRYVAVREQYTDYMNTRLA